jgi:hypothetical protein
VIALYLEYRVGFFRKWLGPRRASSDETTHSLQGPQNHPVEASQRPFTNDQETKR